MSNQINPVLLCGGAGTMLAIVSQIYPKQFVKLLGNESLFQASARRLTGNGFGTPSIVTGSDFRFIVVELAAVSSARDILIEPSARNTGLFARQPSLLKPRTATA